jgi:hypothetical protein
VTIKFLVAMRHNLRIFDAEVPRIEKPLEVVQLVGMYYVFCAM